MIFCITRQHVLFTSRLKSLRFCAAFLTQLWSSSVRHLRRFGSSLLPQKKHCSKVFLNSRRVFTLFFIFKFIVQLSDLSPFSFPFNFCFRLSFCCYMLQYTTCEIKLSILWNKLRNSFELSAIKWNELFSGSKPEKKILRIKHKFPVTDFTFPSVKISKNNFIFSIVTQISLNWYNRNDKPTLATIMTN